MSVVYDRIYIRFKGRVLGPLAHDKVLELVARGQITRDQEMSSDAVNWTKASEFTAFFPIQAQPVVKAHAVPVSPVSPAETSQETWFLNIEGEDTTKSYSEATIRSMIAAGSVHKTTALWNQDAGVWIELGTFRPQWFAQSDREAVAANQAIASSDSQAIGQLLVATRTWLSFLATTGLITTLIVLFASLTGFFTILIGNYATTMRIALVIACAAQVLAALGWLLVCIKLFKYVGRLTAIKYRNEPAEVQAALAAQPSLATALALVFSFWSLVTMTGILIVVIAWQMSPTVSDEEFGHRSSKPIFVAT